jgi:uncharacterized protein
MEAGHPELREILKTEEEIEAILGKPSSRVLAKVIDTLDDICLAYIARPPFVIVASCDAAGHVDVSSKGETLRMTGTARIARDAWLRERMVVAEMQALSETARANGGSQ